MLSQQSEVSPSTLGLQMILPSFCTSTDGSRRHMGEYPHPVEAGPTSKQMHVFPRVQMLEIGGFLCCLWGMLLAVHTAVTDFRNRYRRVGHGNSGCMQPAVAVLQAFWHAYKVANCVLRVWSAAVYCKPASRVQRRLTSRGWADEESHGTGQRVRLRKTNSRMRQVRCEGVRSAAQGCVHRLSFRLC